MSIQTESQLSARLRALRVDPPDGGFATVLGEKLAQATPASERGKVVSLRKFRGNRKTLMLLAAATVFVAGAAAALGGTTGVSNWIASLTAPEPVQREIPPVGRIVKPRIVRVEPAPSVAPPMVPPVVVPTVRQRGEQLESKVRQPVASPLRQPARSKLLPDRSSVAVRALDSRSRSIEPKRRQVDSRPRSAAGQAVPAEPLHIPTVRVRPRRAKPSQAQRAVVRSAPTRAAIGQRAARPVSPSLAGTGRADSKQRTLRAQREVRRRAKMDRRRERRQRRRRQQLTDRQAERRSR